MRLTRQTEVAIAILSFCARAKGRRIHTREASDVANTTRDHAAHIVQDLVREGLLTTTRGRNGGIALALPAHEILLGDVLRRMQPYSVTHVGAAVGSTTANLALDTVLQAAGLTFLAFMDRFSIADLSDDGIVNALMQMDCPPEQIGNPRPHDKSKSRWSANAPFAGRAN